MKNLRKMEKQRYKQPKAELLEMEVKQLMGVSIDDTDATEDPDDFTAKSGLLWENEDETLKWPQQKSSIWDEQ